MREIEFRGYAVEEMVDSQWLYGFGVMSIDYVDGAIEWHLHTLNGTYEVVPESIGQYIGFRDINDKKIYEGNVVRYKDYDGMVRTGVVVFKGGSFAIESPIITSYRLMDYEIEVIGDDFEV